MSPDAYVAKGGLYCPACGSSQIEGGSITIEAGAWQRVHCLEENCDANWVDCYKLTGYRELEVTA